MLADTGQSMSKKSLPFPDGAKELRICCLMLADIGDVLVSTPALALLRQQYPAAHISVIVRKPMSRLLAGNPNVDARILYLPDGIWRKLQLLWRVWREDVDLWVDLHTPTFNTVCSNSKIFRRNSVIRFFANPSFSVGYDCEGALGKHTHGIPKPADSLLSSENVVSTTLRIVRSCTPELNDHEPRKFFHVLPDETRWAARELRSAANGHSLFIGLFFGSKQPADVWSIDHCYEWMTKTLRSYSDAQILLLGGKLEIERARELVARLPVADRDAVRNFVGETSLGETAALISSCKVLVTTDSGPLHIADALDVPMVALFSSKNHPELWRPCQSRAAVLNVPVPCGPCFLSTCPKQLPCIDQILPDDVTDAVKSLLEE